MDEAIQWSLQPLGSLVPSGDHAYLFSSASPIDQQTLEVEIARHLSLGSPTMIHSVPKLVRVEYIGPMRDFIRRLESSIPTSTSDLGWESINRQTGSITRIDTPIEAPIEAPKAKLEIPKRPVNATAGSARIRPRRASAI
jgi:hypothetical protein